MAARKTANDVHSDLRVHEKMCEERWKTIYRKTDDLQASVNSMKGWLLAGLTTFITMAYIIFVN